MLVLLFYFAFKFVFIVRIFTARCTIVQSAVCRVVIACRPSVAFLDLDHIGWKSWKLITWTISPTSSLVIHLLPGEHGEILRRLEVGCGKVVCWSTKAAISLKRVKKEEKLLCRAYKNSPTPFRMVPSLNACWDTATVRCHWTEQWRHDQVRRRPLPTEQNLSIFLKEI